MASRSIKRSNEFYRRALLGETMRDGTKFLGLRSVAKNFNASDGYNLNNIDDWTPAQKARISKYFHELQRLTAQPRYIFRPRNKEHLEQAQRVSGHDKGFKFKVAFVPYTPEFDKSGELIKPDISFEKEGIRIKQSNFSKIKIPFNKINLVKNTEKEIDRAISVNAPNAQYFAIDAHGNEMTQITQKSFVYNRVTNLMNKYNGINPIPKGSGNYGDSPKFHKWDQWLDGLIGYEIPPRTDKIKRLQSVVSKFDTERLKWQKKRRAARKRHQIKGD